MLGDRRDFRLGEKLVFDITSEEDCYILLFNLDSTANLHLVFPNEYSRENLLKAGTRIELPNESMRKGRFEFMFMPPAGEETFKLIASSQRIDWSRSSRAAQRREFDIARGSPLTRSSPTRDLVADLALMLFERAGTPGFRWNEQVLVLRSFPP